jgi:hypothetical protein
MTGYKIPLQVTLTTESEKSGQRGFANLLTGLFGAVRNPLAHAPRTLWPMSEQDALDIFFTGFADPSQTGSCPEDHSMSLYGAYEAPKPVVVSGTQKQRPSLSIFYF